MKLTSFRKMSVAQQFLVVSMSIIALLVIGITVYMIRNSLHSKNEEFKIMAVGRAGGVIEKVDRNFYERFGDVQAFAYNKLAMGCIEKNASDNDIQAFMNTMVTYYVLYDLMMICNEQGEVIAVSAVDKNGKPVDSKFLIGKNFSTKEWFAACMTGKGPEGGAWYSDFMQNDDVTKVYGRTGWGMAFAAPIRDSTGRARGVWYNFANWAEVTGGIRKETEDLLKKAHPEAFILVTNAEHEVIDGDDERMFLKVKASEAQLESGPSFQYEGNKISGENYIAGEMNGNGAYTYKGKNWKAVTFIPKASFTLAYLADNLTYFLLAMVVIIALSAVILYRISSAISRNITVLKKDIEALAKGELLDVADSKMENEIGEMTRAIKTLANGMKATAQFAGHIGTGNLDTQYQVLSDKDKLGQSLMAMQQNLRTVKEEEQKRTWVTEGMAKFGEILRARLEFAQLADKIMSELVKYIRANQGSLFLVNDEDESNIHLDLVASYAWERKKYLTKKIGVGEGLIGQCYLEGDPIYMTQIPQGYIRITSGLGEATPACILILPLKLNDKIYGVIELASFREIESYQKEFLYKLSENIASTLASEKINARTRVLLEQSQQQAEELKAQEEEMRQNIEEMNATQEEMSRKEREYLERIERLEKMNQSVEA
ncbi:MAG: GAF domain-containing protein [Bacteroidetes bacterium]|nr:GAF domain-containing protein [Bacteroidota bacterium]